MFKVYDGGQTTRDHNSTLEPSACNSYVRGQSYAQSPFHICRRTMVADLSHFVILSFRPEITIIFAFLPSSLRREITTKLREIK